MATIAVGGLAGTAGAQVDAPGSVRVVHGLRGLVADVYVDGALALPTFQPERSTEPLALTAGEHLVEIRSAGAAASEAPLLTQTVPVPTGFQGSLVAHLDGSGTPTLSAFADDLAPVPAGQSRVTVRHAAAAGDVNVVINDVPTVPALAPKAEAAQLLGAGSYQLGVTSAADGSVLAPPQNVEFADGTANFMYLIGSQTDGTLGWAVVRVDGLQSPPAMIQTGDGSMAGASDGPGTIVLLLALVVTLCVCCYVGLRVRAHRMAPTAR